MNILAPGDTFVSSKRFLEAALALADSTPRNLLLPLIDKSTSFRTRLAFLVEALVLHERLFCSFPESQRHIFLEQSQLLKVSDLIESLPTQSLFEELAKYGSPDIPNIKLGYTRLN